MTLQPTLLLSPPHLEAVPCADCGTPFMLVVVQGTPMLAGLVVPGQAQVLGNGHQKQGAAQQVPIRQEKAWRICLNCLRREITKPKADGTGWEMLHLVRMERRNRRHPGHNPQEREHGGP